MEEKTTMWPEHYPEKCPPAEAKNVSGQVYRFTNRSSPKCKDFLSYYDLKPEKDWGSKACQARGLSVYTTVEDCETAVAAVPALRRKKLCVAVLSADTGVIAHTPSNNHYNHKTLWSLVGAEELSERFEPLDKVKMAHA
nr:hypothetical protein [uncultured Desulfuromonas sp.]